MKGSTLNIINFFRLQRIFFRFFLRPFFCLDVVCGMNVKATNNIEKWKKLAWIYVIKFLLSFFMLLSCFFSVSFLYSISLECLFLFVTPKAALDNFPPWNMMYLSVCHVFDLSLQRELSFSSSSINVSIYFYWFLLCDYVMEFFVLSGGFFLCIIPKILYIKWPAEKSDTKKLEEINGVENF